MRKSNWDATTKKLGRLKAHTKKVFHFTYSGEGSIKSIVPSCASCTTTHFNTETKVLTVTYKTGSVPLHLGREYDTEKTILVNYANGEIEVLKFKAAIYK